MRQTRPIAIAKAILDDLIHDGALKPGDRLPPVRELQTRYSTSAATVLHALGLLSQQGFIENRTRSGCFVSQTPPEKEQTVARYVGYVSCNMPAEVLGRAYQGLSQVCKERGYGVRIADTNMDYETERREVAGMIEAGCSAVILHVGQRTREDLRRDYLNREFTDFPIVLLIAAYPGQKRASVVLDDYQAGYDMTEFLIDEGHRRIGFMIHEFGGRGWTYWSTQERFAGYRDALRAHGLQFESLDFWRLTFRGYDEMIDGINEALKAWQAQPQRPTAMIAIEDGVAMCTMNLAKQIRIAVPDELIAVGFDNLSQGRTFVPAFTTTDPDYALAGATAARIAIRMAEGDLPIRAATHVLHTPLLIRRPLSI